MRILFLILLFFSNFGFGQQTISDSININGIYRNFIIYIPSINQPSQPCPLVFNLHGKTGTSLGQMWYGDFRDIADTANFIIVHPQGLLDINGDTHWNLGQSTVDDIGFLNSLYSYVVSNYNIILEQVYSVGMSNGGYMSYFLACNMSDKIAAIASVTGAMGPFTQLNCNANHPTPILQIHGTADTTVPFNDIVNGLEYWRDYNNCDISADTFQLPNFSLSDSSTVEYIIYNNGDNGVTTELFKIHNGGHTWPGNSLSIGLTNYDINASLEIWKFFSRYDINGLIETSTAINDNIIEDQQLIKIMDILGKNINKTKNTLLFYIYYDGTVEKRIIIE